MHTLPTAQETGHSQPLLLSAAALLLLCAACASPLTGPARHPGDRDAVVIEARGCLGAPYRWGGDSPAGFDCSGLVCYVYNRVYGITLPHNSAALHRRGRTVTLRNAARGDLLFFGEGRRSPISHVGIYIGGQEFIHASSSRGVIVSRLSDSYYSRRLIAVKRLPLAR